MCVPWELNPQPFALLTQCFTTEPEEHFKAIESLKCEILWHLELLILFLNALIFQEALWFLLEDD